MEAGVGIEPAYTALQAAAVYRQIKHFGQFHFRQTRVNRSKNRLFFKDREWRGESDFSLPTVTAFWTDSLVPDWRLSRGIVRVSRCIRDRQGEGDVPQLTGHEVAISAGHRAISLKRPILPSKTRQ
jgi:hypothetical protein